MALSPSCKFVRVRVALSVGLAALSISNALADSNSTDHRRPRERIYKARPAEVALQPFSLDRPLPATSTTIQVAYYTPRAVPRAEPIARDEESEARPEFETSGARPIVRGNRAVLRNGISYAPSNSPDRVKSAIWAVNSIRNRPYV
jgi:hypothetical protein